MAIKPFKIVLEDGSIDRSEYSRCIEFLNSYIAGDIKVYRQTTWANPYEVDLSQRKSAMQMLSDIVQINQNKLLNQEAFKHIQGLFKAALEYYGATIHTAGAYLESSANFADGLGHMYDVLKDDKEVKVKKYDLSPEITAYCKDDMYHTVLEYSDNYYRNDLDYNTFSVLNHPYGTNANKRLVSNVDGYPHVYKGYPSGVYTYFNGLSGQFVGSSTLFYFGECNDILYTSGLNHYYDDRLGEVVVTRREQGIKNSVQPTKGFEKSRVNDIQSKIENIDQVNAYLNYQALNPTMTYLTPIDLTAAEQTEWLI